jgi:hypothetical protein
LSNGLNVRVHPDAPSETTAAHPKGYRLRPVVALLGLILIAVATLFGIASSLISEQPDAVALISCAPCHD